MTERPNLEKDTGLFKLLMAMKEILDVSLILSSHYLKLEMV